MEHVFINNDGVGKLRLIKNKAGFEQYFYKQESDFTFHTIAWNRGKAQVITIDEVQYPFAANSILPIMLNQSFKFERSEDIIAWQFNREFYCIANHDAEVGCVGFLFFGPSPTMFISLDNEQNEKMQRLLEVFEEEYESNEDIKGEMLRMLLVRLIIQLTRLAKKQYLGTEHVVEEKFNLIRQFNLLVEIHFRKERQLSFYANLLNKSPKTISNYFSLYSKKTPLQIIQERVIAEAKRLFYYTDKSVKEIADEIGFEDAAHFSKFFKKCTSQSPSELKKVL
jgi:AraC family transcriptional regulator, transcriptional activator of pobA